MSRHALKARARILERHGGISAVPWMGFLPVGHELEFEEETPTPPVTAQAVRWRRTAVRCGSCSEPYVP